MSTAMTWRLTPEIEAATHTLMASLKDALPTGRARLSRVVLFLALFVIGFAGGWVLLTIGLLSAKSADFWRSTLTALSVLSGFMVTTMVFTGKIDVSKSLSLTELRDVTAKLNHLLLFQFSTLVNHIACLSAALLVPAVAEKVPSLGVYFAAFACALLFVSLVRSLFVPLQILELHRFTHAALLREKREEASKTENM